MSFMDYQYMNPEFLNNYLKYKRYIEYYAQSTIDEAYYDLRTYFRYLKLKNDEILNIDTITIEEFKLIQIKDITLDVIRTTNPKMIEEFIYFLKYTLENDVKTRNRKFRTIS